MRAPLIQTIFLFLYALCYITVCSAFAQDNGVSKPLVSKAPKPIIVQPVGYKSKPITQESLQGEDYFKELNCMACHSIHNVGGVIGPMLDGIGARRSEEYLFAQLANTQEQKEQFAKIKNVDIDSLHHMRLSEKTSKCLIAYLLSLSEPAGGFILYPHVRARPAQPVKDNPSFKPDVMSEAAAVGKGCYERNGCIACHSINNIGGWLGPRLDGIGGRRNKQEIIQYITKPPVRIRESTNEQEVWPQMPNLNLTETEIAQLTTYLKTLPNLKN